MKIILIRFSIKSEIRLSDCVETLGLGYLAAVLRKEGFEVDIFDSAFKYISEEKIIGETLKSKYGLIGFTIDDPSNIDVTFDLIRKLRIEGAEGHITIGGHTPTFAFKEILEECPDIDSVVRFEGECTLLELARAIDSGKDWKMVSGLSIKHNGKIISNSLRPLIQDLDFIPDPERDTLFLATKENQKRAAISASRGCYGNCTYCSVCSFYKIPPGNKWRARSPYRVVDEIEKLVKHYGVEEIEFIDDNFIGRGKRGQNRAFEIANEIIRRKIDIMFGIYCRSSDVDIDVFQRLKEAGLREVLIGLESGVDEVLKRLNKGASVKINIEALGILKRLEIAPTIGFIMFDPYTTLEELNQNLAFLESTGLNYLRVSLNLLQPYIGTSIHVELFKNHKLKGNYKKLRYTFLDNRTQIVFDILSRTMQEIPVLSLYLGQVERELRRLIYLCDKLKFGDNYYRKEKSVVRDMMTECMANFNVIYKDIINFASDSPTKELGKRTVFIKDTKMKLHYFSKKYITIQDIIVNELASKLSRLRATEKLKNIDGKIWL